MTTSLNIATDGYVGCELNTISIVSNGYLCSVTIEDVTPDDGGYLVKGLSRNLRRKEREKREKEKDFKDEKCENDEVLKVITVVVTINGKDHVESKMIKCKPDITVNDVDVQVVNRDDKPKITISLIKK